MPWGWNVASASNTMTLPFRRKSKQIYTITEPDPIYQVIYLGNVVTVLAKGDGCVDKPIALIWKTHLQRARTDLTMKLTVTKSGLKAETKMQGLTEYWAHRITYCASLPEFPKVFCWVYKHEGKKMKPELRCHAVLCRKANEPGNIAVKLHDSLHAALLDYKRDKISKQHTRLSGMLSGYPTLPRRKLLLKAAQTFRPPISRSKSAPKLGSIEEGSEEEEDEEDAKSRILEPGTPRELEFGDAIPGDRSLLLIDIEIGNDIDKLRLEERVFRNRFDVGGRNSVETDPDSVSDESGYHEEKSSLEGEDSEEEEPDILVTAL